MRNVTFLALLVITLASPAAAQFVASGGAIPAVANARGENNTFWRSDVSILNVSPAATSVRLLLLPELKSSGPAFEPQVSEEIPIPGNGQLTLANVVTSVFELHNAIGGIQIISDFGARLVLASRTYTNDPDGGSYGLNVYGALIVSETAWVANVQDDAFSRTNIGVFVPAGASPANPVTFTITVKNIEGAEIASGSIVFDQVGLIQKSLEFFGVEDPLLDGSVTIVTSDPAAIWYAYSTVIDNVTGDSVYRPAIGRQ